MKKSGAIALVLVLAISLVCLTACGNDASINAGLKGVQIADATELANAFNTISQLYLGESDDSSATVVFSMTLTTHNVIETKDIAYDTYVDYDGVVKFQGKVNYCEFNEKMQVPGASTTISAKEYTDNSGEKSVLYYKDNGSWVKLENMSGDNIETVVYMLDNAGKALVEKFSSFTFDEANGSYVADDKNGTVTIFKINADKQIMYFSETVETETVSSKIEISFCDYGMTVVTLPNVQ